MEEIRVDTDGFAALSADCAGHAVEISAACASPSVIGGFEATSAAVQAVHGEVQRAANRISARLQSTGQEAAEAMHDFQATETDNANMLA